MCLPCVPAICRPGECTSFQVSYEKATFTSIGGTLDGKVWCSIPNTSSARSRHGQHGVPNQKGAYATIGYRFGKFLPHITYATLDDNDNPLGGPAVGNGIPLKQTSATLGLRYELVPAPHSDGGPTG